MNNEKLLRDFIKEQLSAADAEKLVGRYLWPLRSKMNPPKSKTDPRYEEDTPEEAALYKQFLEFVLNHQRSPMTAKSLKTIYDLVQTGRYSKVLSKTPKKPVYRGMSVGLSWFKRNFGISYEEFIKKTETMQKVEFEDMRGPYSFFLADDGIRDITPPGEAVMSWSKSFGQAAVFAVGSGASGADFNVPIIFEALPSENMMVDIGFIYALAHDYADTQLMRGRSVEQEVLSLGPVVSNKVYCGTWDYRREDLLTPRHYVSAERDPKRPRVPGLPDKIYATPEETDADFEKRGYQDIPRRK